jgi:hypothetical protein
MPQACRIDARGYVVTSDRKIHVSKGKHEDVLWVATQNGGPWKITFDKDKNGSPFSESSYDVGRGASGGSTGGPIEGSRQNMEYHYNVRDANGRVTDDPDIEIDP